MSDKIKDAEIIEEKNKGKSKSLRLIIGIFVILLGVAVLVSLNNLGLLKIQKINLPTGKKAELN